MGLFGFFSKEKKESLDKGLEKTRESFFSKLTKTLIGKSSIDDDVLDNLEEVLPHADLFLSASETESFGLSMLEAMSCGVPCVSTAVGGVSEVLGDTGRLTPFGDPEAMAKAALPLLDDPKLHTELSERARQRAVEHFATDRVVANYISVYERVLG